MPPRSLRRSISPPPAKLHSGPWFELDRWVFHEAKLAALGTIIAHGVRYPVRLVYADQFPEVPAWVEPQEDVRWSTHQHGNGGALCLELRPAEAGPLLLRFTGGSELTAFHLIDGGQPHRRRMFVLPDEADARSGGSAQAVARRVAIVGAGSVGSKVAESLVRSGISRLTLVDGDVMLPGNVERHALDWRDVGFRKVHGVRRHLLHISPGADIKVVAANLNWQRSARDPCRSDRIHRRL